MITYLWYLIRSLSKEKATSKRPSVVAKTPLELINQYSDLMDEYPLGAELMPFIALRT